MQRHEIIRQIIDWMSDDELDAYIYGYAMAKDELEIHHGNGIVEYYQLHARSESVFYLEEEE
jgi:hypothetical protein